MCEPIRQAVQIFGERRDHPHGPEPKPGIKYNMGTFDEVITASTIGFMDKAKKDGKPFFVWTNPTRAHVLTHLSPKYDAMRNPETDFGLEEAAMKQMDDNIGVVLAWLKDNGEEDNTIVIFTTDNGAEVYTWPDGGTTPFAGAKGEVTEGAFRVPALIKWLGHVKPGSVSHAIISGLDWFPTLVAAAGNPNITDQLLKGVDLCGRTLSVHGVNFGTATITATAQGLPSATATVQVTATLAFAPSSATLIGTPAQKGLTLLLSAFAPAGGLTVNLSSDNTAVATVPSIVTIPANATKVLQL
jgi:hypothetical protein